MKTNNEIIYLGEMKKSVRSCFALFLLQIPAQRGAAAVARGGARHCAHPWARAAGARRSDASNWDSFGQNGGGFDTRDYPAGFVAGD